MFSDKWLYILVHVLYNKHKADLPSKQFSNELNMLVGFSRTVFVTDLIVLFSVLMVYIYAALLLISRLS